MNLGEDKKELMKVILSECSWDVDRAIKKYRQDLEWERKYSKALSLFKKRSIREGERVLKDINMNTF